jgi:hypothetical protein
MIKAMMKVELEGLHLKMIKSIYEKPLANIIVNGETWNHFLFSQEQERGGPLPSRLFNILLEITVK